MDDGVILRRTLPRALDELVRQADDAVNQFCAWVFEDQETRRHTESLMAARGNKARIRSAYKPLLHFFLEEVELSGLRSVEIETPNHELAFPQRFRIETYPLAGLLRDVPIRFSEGNRPLHYIVTLEYGLRRIVHEVFKIHRGIPYVVGVSENFVPRFTLVAEYLDETIHGDAFRLAHTVQMSTVIEAARLLDEGWLPAGR